MTALAAAALLLLGALLAAVILPLVRRSGPPASNSIEERIEALSVRLDETSFALEQALGRLRPEGETAAAAAGPAPKVTPDAAIARAAAFLRRRLRSGAYGLSCTGSDGTPRFSDNKGHVFVAFFVAEAMSGLLDEIDRTILLTRLLSEEIDGKWGFSPPGPFHDQRMRVFHVDADDTAYVIRTLRSLGVNRPPDSLLGFYREPERLFVTFDGAGPARLSTQASPQNNFLAHPEVNANIFLALAGTHLEQVANYDALRGAQDERGAWTSYFYPSPLFGTALAVDALAAHDASAPAIERALSFIAESQNEDGSWGSGGDALETALAVAALAGRSDHAESQRRGIESLLATIAEDGSWSSPACIWQFHAGDGDVWRAFDRHRTFVTARCMTALRRAGRASSAAQP